MSKFPAIEGERIIEAPIEKVWDVLTNPEKIKIYMYGTETISDFKEGSPISFTGEWEGKKYEDKGVILKFEPNKAFSYSYWSNFSGIPDVPENYAILSFQLEARPSGTHLRFSQRNSPTQTMYEHSLTGWTSVLDSIVDLAKQ